MTFYEFLLLNKVEQAAALLKKGAFVADRIEGKYKMLLYQVDSFYVELCFHIEKKVLQSLNSFSNTDLLKPYTDGINLDGLIDQK